MSNTTWKAWEREVAAGFTGAGLPSKRRPVGHEAREGNCGDLEGEAERFFFVSCKDEKSPSPWKHVRDVKAAAEAAGRGQLPVAFVKRKNGRGRPTERLALMDPEDYFRLVALAFFSRNESETSDSNLSERAKK